MENIAGPKDFIFASLETLQLTGILISKKSMLSRFFYNLPVCKLWCDNLFFKARYIKKIIQLYGVRKIGLESSIINAVVIMQCNGVNGIYN